MTVIFGLALMGLLIYDFIDMNLYQTFTINQEWFTLVLVSSYPCALSLI